MLWSICFFITAAVILECTVTALVARFKGKGKKRSVKLLHVLFAVCFLSAVLLCIPPYHEIHGAEGIGIVQTAVFSVQKAIRVFGADEMCDIVLDNIGKAPVWLSGIYSTAALAIQFVAPLLTFSFLISFFKNLLSYRRYLAAFWKDAHIFSEMNEKSVALARSIAEQDRRERKGRCGSGVMLAFTDVLEENEESYFDLLEEAKELGAVIFRKDLDAIHFAPRLWRRKLHFYLINDDAAEKIRHAASIAENYDTEDAEMYVFSDNLSCGLLLSAMDNRHIRVYRVNDIQALIYHNLSLYGARLFQNARIHNGSVISAVIVGLGRYGTEMLKALLWYGQMTGFMMKIHVFDEDKNAESLFTAQCPEVMQMNKKPVDGESPFDVTFHSGIDAGSAEFTRLLGEIPDATYVFVSLGGDEKNVAASIRIRTLYERVNPALSRISKPSCTIPTSAAPWA